MKTDFTRTDRLPRVNASMSKRKYWLGFWAIIVSGFIIRMISLCPYGFFCDVPPQLKAMRANTFFLFFPGYMPLQLLFWGLAQCGLELFQAMWLISLACGVGSVFYVALAARRAAGEGFSLLAAAVMAFGILPVYFSVAGASYPTDMLCVSGMIFHGWEYLRSRKAGSYYLALAWLCFGIMMRPISAGFCCAGLAVLLWQGRDWRAALVSMLALALTVAAYTAISVHYYGSLAAIIHASQSHGFKSEVGDRGWRGTVSNLARVGIYAVYGFQVWLVFTGWLAWRNWRLRKGLLLLFLLALAGPYFLFLIGYIPHAGYYCLLIPAVALLPACFLPPLPSGGLRFFGWVGAAFVAVALCQWLLIRPVPTTSLATGAANAYILQYSRSGIRQGMFETLASIMFKNNLETNLISPQRANSLRDGGH